MTMNKTALVLGVTGGIGGAIAAALGRHGWTVRGLARDRHKAATDWSGQAPAPLWIEGDAMNRPDVVAAAKGVDAIVHAVNPPGYRSWEQVVLPMMANTIAAAETAGARIVLPGTIYNFDPQQLPVIGHDSPQVPRTRKGAVRVEMEQMLENAAPAVPSLVVRAGDFFGPDARTSWFAQAMVKTGTPVRRVLNPASGPGHSWAYLPDLAETFARLLDVTDRLDPFERVQFEGYRDTSGSGMVEAVRRAVGRDVPERAFPWWLMRLLAPFGGFPREVIEIEQYWRHPVRFDNRRLEALIGEEPRTPFDEAIRTTLAALDCLDQPAAFKPQGA